MTDICACSQHSGHCECNNANKLINRTESGLYRARDVLCHFRLLGILGSRFAPSSPILMRKSAINGCKIRRSVQEKAFSLALRSSTSPLSGALVKRARLIQAVSTAQQAGMRTFQFVEFLNAIEFCMHAVVGQRVGGHPQPALSGRAKRTRCCQPTHAPIPQGVLLRKTAAPPALLRAGTEAAGPVVIPQPPRQLLLPLDLIMHTIAATKEHKECKKSACMDPDSQMMPMGSLSLQMLDQPCFEYIFDVWQDLRVRLMMVRRPSRRRMALQRMTTRTGTASPRMQRLCRTPPCPTAAARQPHSLSLTACAGPRSTPFSAWLRSAPLPPSGKSLGMRIRAGNRQTERGFMATCVFF